MHGKNLIFLLFPMKIVPLSYVFSFKLFFIKSRKFDSNDLLTIAKKIIQHLANLSKYIIGIEIKNCIRSIDSFKQIISIVSLTIWNV